MADFWSCVYTQPQAERRAAAGLGEQGYECYLPMMRKRLGGECPLFARYLFVFIGNRWSSIDGTRGVTGLLMDGDRPARLRNGERFIAELRRRQDVNGLVELERFRRGDLVRVEKGPLRGLVGLYQGMSNRERVNVLMTMLGAEVRVNLRESDLYYA
jgi:transcriptional antiterminator RfaH